MAKDFEIVDISKVLLDRKTVHWDLRKRLETLEPGKGIKLYIGEDPVKCEFKNSNSLKMWVTQCFNKSRSTKGLRRLRTKQLDNTSILLYYDMESDK